MCINYRQYTCTVRTVRTVQNYGQYPCTVRTVRTVHKGPGSDGWVEVHTEIPEHGAQNYRQYPVQYVLYAQYIKVLAQMAGWRSVQRYLNMVHKITDSTCVQYVQYAQYIKVLAQMVVGWRSVQRYLNIVYNLETVHMYSMYNKHST